MITLNADPTLGNHAVSIQNAINRAAATPDRTIELVGTFELGEGDQAKTVEIEKGVTILGRGTARIHGGGAQRNSPAWANREAHVGAFRICNTDGKATAIKGVWFESWRGEAIFVESCRGLDIEDCRFTLPISGTIEQFKGPDNTGDIKLVSAIWAVGVECRGKLKIHGNICDLLHYHDASDQADDEQFFGVLNTNFETVSVTLNSIAGSDDGIEVLQNLYPGATIDISGNVMRLNHTNRFLGSDYRWWGSAAIICCANEHSLVSISSNDIGVYGSNGSAFCLTGNYIITKSQSVPAGAFRPELRLPPWMIVKNVPIIHLPTRQAKTLGPIPGRITIQPGMRVVGNKVVQVVDPNAADKHFASVIMGYNLPMNRLLPEPYDQLSLGASLYGAMFKDNEFSGGVTCRYVAFDARKPFCWMDLAGLRQIRPGIGEDWTSNRSSFNFIEDHDFKEGELTCKLYLGPDTSNNVCIGSFPQGSYVDEGTNNRISDSSALALTQALEVVS